MTVYEVAIHKANTAYGNHPFANTYHVNASSIAQALGYAADIAVIESQLFATTVSFYEVSGFIPHSRGSGGRQATGYTGLRTASGAILPEWNVCRVDFQSALTSHIMRKYLRVGLGEGDVVGSALEAAMLALLATYYTDIINSSQACMPNGVSLSTSGGGESTGIAMRQPKHNRAHKAGFKRGWVPV